MIENKSYFNTFDPEQNLLHIALPCWSLNFSGQSHNSNFNFIERAVLGLAKLGFSDPAKVAAKLCLPEDLVRLTWTILRNRGFFSSRHTLEDFEREEQQNIETISFNVIQEGITGRVLPVAFTKDVQNLYVEPSGKYSIGPVGKDLQFLFDCMVKPTTNDKLIQRSTVEDVHSVLQKLADNYDFGDFLPEYQVMKKCNISQLELESSTPFNLHCICRIDDNHDQVLVSFFDKVQNVSHELSEALMKTPDYDLIKYRLLLKQYQIQSMIYSSEVNRAQDALSEVSSENSFGSGKINPSLPTQCLDSQTTSNLDNTDTNALTHSESTLVVHPSADLQLQKAQEQTELMVQQSMQYKFGTPYPDLEKVLCIVNQTYSQLQLYYTNYNKGELVAQYHAFMQKCVFKMFEACELSLGYINQQAVINTAGFNRAYFDRIVKILHLSMLPDPVVLADVIKCEDQTVSAQVLNKLSQLSLEQMSILLSEYCRRKHYTLASCASEEPDLSALQFDQANAANSNYAMGNIAWKVGQEEGAKVSASWSDDGREAFVSSELASDEGSILNVLDLLQDPDVFTGLGLAYEWCRTLEDQFHSLSRIDLDYAGNPRIQLVRSMMLGLLDAVKNRGVLKQSTANYQQLLGNLWALKKARDAWAHGDISSSPVSLQTIECWHTMLLELLSPWNGCLTDILKINLKNAQDLHARQCLDLNIKLGILHYFDHFFLRDLGADLGYMLYAAESAMQSAQISGNVERTLPVYLYSQQHVQKPQSSVPNSSTEDSLQGADLKVSAQPLLYVASFFQQLFLSQLLRISYDPQELAQSQDSMLNKLVLNLSLAGFVLPDGKLPYGLSRVSTKFIQNTIFIKNTSLRRKNTLGSCLLVYLYVLPQAQLSTLAANWPSLVVDIDELIGLREHGHDKPVNKQQVLSLKERLYTGVFKAFKDVVKSKR